MDIEMGKGRRQIKLSGQSIEEDMPQEIVPRNP